MDAGRGFKRRFIVQADLLPDQIIVGVGCGTGTLFLMLKDAQLKAIVKGLDADPQILRLAQKSTEEYSSHLLPARTIFPSVL